jgi:hypothetical protein
VICGQAGAGDILVSRTVRDLVVGSGTGFEDRGPVELRGVPGTWQLLAVDRHGARAGSAEGVNAHPRTADGDAPLGPRRGDDRDARTVDPPRDGTPHPGHRPPLNSRSQRALEVSQSTTSLTGESPSDATDADASAPANYPHSQAAEATIKWNYPKIPGRRQNSRRSGVSDEHVGRIVGYPCRHGSYPWWVPGIG